MAASAGANHLDQYRQAGRGMAKARDGSYYLGEGRGAASADRWIRKHRRLRMPHIGLDNLGIVSFTDGRHRFAWMRDHGAKALPVSCDRKIGDRDQKAIWKRKPPNQSS